MPLISVRESCSMTGSIRRENSSIMTHGEKSRGMIHSTHGRVRLLPEISGRLLQRDCRAGRAAYRLVEHAPTDFRRSRCDHCRERLCEHLQCGYPGCILTIPCTSFFNDTMTDFSFVGFGNDKELFSDPVFLKSLKSTARLVVVTVPAVTSFSLWVGAAIYQMRPIGTIFAPPRRIRILSSIIFRSLPAFLFRRRF